MLNNYYDRLLSLLINQGMLSIGLLIFQSFKVMKLTSFPALIKIDVFGVYQFKSTIECGMGQVELLNMKAKIKIYAIRKPGIRNVISFVFNLSRYIAFS